MKGLILIGVNEKTHTIKRISNELTKSGLFFDFFKWGDLVFESASLWAKNKRLNLDAYSAAFLDSPGYDLVQRKSSGSRKKIIASISLPNELYLIGNILQNKGKFTINGRAILKYPYYNKFSQSYFFGLKSIPSIKTIHIGDNEPTKVQNILKKFGFRFPVVVKKSTGGLGLGVYKVENKKELGIFLKNKRGLNLVYQPYLKNDGDYRVLVLNGKSLGIIKRKAAAGGWKNNFALGGSVEKYNDPKMERFAEMACCALNLDLAGVDIFKIKNKYIVIEINIFPCFEGFEKVFPEINVAERIIRLMTKDKT
jgi:RimK family alpha-L-glutamate ligase